MNFIPTGPTNTREHFSKLPDNRDLTLRWAPFYGEVSQAGDLGYTTGPFIQENKTDGNARPALAGYYFSVWQRQIDGTWKVVVNLGTRTPDTTLLTAKSFQGVTNKGKAIKDFDLTLERNGLLAADRELTATAASTSTGRALLKYLAADGRLHRDGLFPFTDAKAIRSLFNAGETLRYAWTPIKADIAASGDLGYTYGSYEARSADPNFPIQKGYYLRVWRRDGKGRWAIVADVSN